MNVNATQATSPAATSLLPADVDMFAHLGIPFDLLSAAHIERVTDHEARERFGIRFDGAKDCSGLVFPYYVPAVNWRVTARLRRDYPEVKDGRPENKYLCPYGDSRHLYFPPGAKEKLADPETVIVLVESEKAALAITAWAERHGIKLVALAMGGCWGWRGQRVRSEIAPNGERVDVAGPLPDLNYGNGHRVYILFDTNVATNVRVQQARIALVVELSKAHRNSTVLVCDLPVTDNVNGPDDYIAECGDEAMGKVFADAFSPADRSVGRQEEEWPDPEDLGAELPPVPEFDLELLPASLRPLVEDTAERMGCAVDFIACAAVVALAAVTNRRAEIQPKACDSDWVEQGNLWGLVVGVPGSMKTPATNVFRDILRKIEKEWVEEYEEAKKQYLLDKEDEKIQHDAWAEQYKQHLKDKQKNPHKPERPESKAVEPRQKRLLTSDPTQEKLHEVLSVNPLGMTLWRDEISGWIANLSRPGREGERAYFLECWPGNGQHTSDRIVRGSTFADHLCLTMFGSIQPGLLPRLFQDEFAHGVNSDGLVPRFQIAVYPDIPAKTPYVDRLPDSDAIRKATTVYRRLAALDADKPKRLRFDYEAQELFVEWYSALRQRLNSNELSPVMQAHLSKYPKLMPTLAMLFELADLAALDDKEKLENAKEVGLVHTQQAADWCGYLEQHAHRIYARHISPERAAAISLIRQLKKGWRGDTVQGDGNGFTLRDVYRNEWTGLGTPEEAEAALKLLEDAGWVRRVVVKPNTGRPSLQFEINPKVAGGSHVHD